MSCCSLCPALQGLVRKRVVPFTSRPLQNVSASIKENIFPKCPSLDTEYLAPSNLPPPGVTDSGGFEAKSKGRGGRVGVLMAGDIVYLKQEAVTSQEGGAEQVVGEVLTYDSGAYDTNLRQG